MPLAGLNITMTMRMRDRYDRLTVWNQVSFEGSLALRAVVDEVVCVLTPEPFDAVGAWYKDFSPTSDDEVRALLARPTRVETFPSAV